MTRNAFGDQIQDLRDNILAMARLVDRAVARSTDALRKQDTRAAQDVIDADQEINRLRWRTEEKALLVIATQAPMAGDLRVISAVIHIATELERIADHAAGNAKIVIETSSEPLLKPLVDIPRMAELAREMLSESLAAFSTSDPEAAKRTARRDDEVDQLYDQIYRELLTYMLADPTTINRATRLLWAAHNVERMADRVTNICERVVFAASGRLEEIPVSIN